MDGFSGWLQARSPVELEAIGWGVFFGLWLAAGAVLTVAGIQ